MPAPVRSTELLCLILRGGLQAVALDEMDGLHGNLWHRRADAHENDVVVEPLYLSCDDRHAAVQFIRVSSRLQVGQIRRLGHVQQELWYWPKDAISEHCS